MKKQKISEFVEYNNEKFTKRIMFKEGDSTVFVLNFEPGQSLPTHKHPGSHVYLLVLQGQGVFTINNEKVEVEKDDVVLCTGEEEMAFTNTGTTNCSLYVNLNKIPNERYAENI
ncbi:cupin domain-containing protein [Neobacillus pocheonensis]|uniref:cupin domain-containing protein n=1 Tax=Neobacillus pocheonensis TaxID=363869 RepID=UPI003D274B80